MAAVAMEAEATEVEMVLAAGGREGVAMEEAAKAVEKAVVVMAVVMAEKMAGGKRAAGRRVAAVREVVETEEEMVGEME